jgi:hypothetical protein
MTWIPATVVPSAVWIYPLGSPDRNSIALTNFSDFLFIDLTLKNIFKKLKAVFIFHFSFI